MISFLKKLKKKESDVLRKKTRPRRLTTIQFQLLIGVMLAIIIALLITAIWYSTRIASLQITAVNVVGGQTIPESLIREKTDSILDGTYIRLIPKRFIPLYPKHVIEEAILSLDRVKNVHVEMTDNQTVVVVFDEYVPFALWCEKPDAELCLFIDRAGFSFAQAPLLEGSAFVRYVEQNRAPEVSTVLFEVSFIDETAAFIEKLETELNLFVTHVTKVGTYDIEYTISGGGLIKVSQTLPMEESFKNLETILSSEEFANIEPGAFQYIDLRFGDKIFVNEALPEDVTSSTTATTSNSL